MVKDSEQRTLHQPSTYCSLIVLPLFFLIFPLFTFDWNGVDEIVFGQRQLTVYLHKPPVKDPVEIDKYCPLLPKSLGIPIATITSMLTVLVIRSHR